LKVLGGPAYRRGIEDVLESGKELKEFPSHLLPISQQLYALESGKELKGDLRLPGGWELVLLLWNPERN